MNPARKLIALSMSALVVALTGCTSTDPEARAEEPKPSVSGDSPSANDGPTDMLGMQGPLDPGLYSIPAWGMDEATSPRVIFDVPEGYHANGGWVIDSGDGVTDDQYGGITVWHVLQVLTDPCHRRSAVDAGPTVQDLARALIRQAGPSTRPEGIVLDGHPGVTLDVTIPPDIDLSRCTGDEYSLWRTERRGDGRLAQDTPGLVNRLWIVDVDGTRLVLVADLFPDQPAALHQEQATIAESVHFEPTGS